MKSKILAGLLIVVAVAVLGTVLFYKPCKQPGEEVIKIVQIGCAFTLNAQELTVEICKALDREENCELTEEDKPFINRYLNDAVNKCAAQQLEDEGYCTDKIQDLVKWI